MRRNPWNHLLLAVVIVAAALALSCPQPRVAEAQSIISAPNPIANTVLPISDWINDYPLTAGDDQAVTVPALADFVVFSMDGVGTFWLKRGATCSVPVTTITNGTGAEPNPSARRVAGGSQFCIIT